MNTIEKAGGPSGVTGPENSEFEEGGIRVCRATATFGPDEPLALDSGESLAPFTIASDTHGTLNAAHSTLATTCHPLTLHQYPPHTHPP